MEKIAQSIVGDYTTFRSYFLIAIQWPLSEFSLVHCSKKNYSFTLQPNKQSLLCFYSTWKERVSALSFRNRAVATRWSSLGSKSTRSYYIPAAWYLRNSPLLWWYLDCWQSVFLSKYMRRDYLAQRRTRRDMGAARFFSSRLLPHSAIPPCLDFSTRPAPFALAMTKHSS